MTTAKEPGSPIFAVLCALCALCGEMSLEADVSPGDVDVRELQAKLKAAGCIVDEEDIEAANAGL